MLLNQNKSIKEKTSCRLIKNYYITCTWSQAIKWQMQDLNEVCWMPKLMGINLLSRLPENSEQSIQGLGIITITTEKKSEKIICQMKQKNFQTD